MFENVQMLKFLTWKAILPLKNGLHNVILNLKCDVINVMSQSIVFTKAKTKFSIKFFSCWENHDQEIDHLIQIDWNVVFFLEDGVQFKEINWSTDFNSIYCSIQSSWTFSPSKWANSDKKISSDESFIVKADDCMKILLIDDLSLVTKLDLNEWMII